MEQLSLNFILSNAVTTNCDDIERQGAVEPVGSSVVAKALVEDVAAPKITTVGDMIGAIANHQGVSHQRRRNLACSLRWLAKFERRPPELIVADLQQARSIIDDTLPIAFNLGMSRFANIRSDILACFKLLDLIPPQKPARETMKAPWRRLFDACPKPEQRYRLSRFFNWSSAEGHEPADVSQTLLETFVDHIAQSTFKSRPQKFRRQIAKAWNECMATVPDWPKVKLSSPKYKPGWTLDWDEFAPSFIEDRDRWLARRSGADLLDDESLVRSVRPATLEHNRFQLREAASALVRSGVDVGDIQSLGDLVQTDNFKRIVRFLLDRQGGPSERIHGLARDLLFMAKHHAHLPADELDRLKVLVGRLRVKRKGLTAKTKERLRAFEDPQILGRLLLLPAELMTEATKTRRAPQKAALLAQNAVAIELLLMTALRKRNLTALELNTHVFLGGDPKNPTAFISIPEQETKNGSPLEFELPLESARLLIAYVDRFLPALAEPGQSHLFPGQTGRAKRPNNFGEHVTKVVADRVGARVHVHLFRHLTSKVFLDANPGLYEAVRRVLGHQSIDTTTMFYTGFETKAAARQFDETILAQRRQAESAGKQVRVGRSKP